MRPHPAAQAISLFFGSKHAPLPPKPRPPASGFCLRLRDGLSGQ